MTDTIPLLALRSNPYGKHYTPSSPGCFLKSHRAVSHLINRHYSSLPPQHYRISSQKSAWMPSGFSISSSRIYPMQSSAGGKGLEKRQEQQRSAVLKGMASV